MSLTSQVSNPSCIDFSGFELEANSEDGDDGWWSEVHTWFIWEDKRTWLN
jgi:hypothetical protein